MIGLVPNFSFRIRFVDLDEWDLHRYNHHEQMSLKADTATSRIRETKDTKMLLEHIELQDRILAMARNLSLVSVDACFSASEVAVNLGITDQEVLCELARLEETDWVVRVESDWSIPATGKTRWVVMEHARLTIGKRYEVLAIENDLYRILDDSDEPVLYDPSCFMIIDDSRPSFWICSTGEDGDQYCEPPEWAGNCFFEKYHDGVESVRDQFWKDLRKYYPFTWSERLKQR